MRVTVPIAPWALTLLVSFALGCRAAPEVPAGPVTVRIVALNDFHGGLYEQELRELDGRAVGGLPWLSAAVQALRREDPELLLLDAGDSFQGTWPVNASKGAGSVQAFELLGVDATAVGNHEFDYGPGGPGSHPLRGALEQAAERARYPFLTANVFYASGAGRPYRPEGVAPWKLFERRGVRVGVIGLTTTDTPQTTRPAHVADLRFEDPVETLRRVVPEVRAAGAQVVVALAHVTGACRPESFAVPGPPCVPDGELGRMLTDLPRGFVDVIVAGHAHGLMAFRWGDTFVLENRTRGQGLGMLDLAVGPDGVDPDASVLHPPWMLVHEPVDPGCSGEPFPLRPLDVGGRRLDPDPAALGLVQALEREAGSPCAVVGCATEWLEVRRHDESVAGNSVADAIRAAFPDSDLAVTNAGGIRAALPPGDIRRGQVHDMLPFDNQVVLLEVTGEQLVRLLRIGSSGAHGLLQVSGARYRFDPARAGGSDLDGDGAVAKWEEDRLCDLTVGGAPVLAERTYRLATIDFLHEGGDHMGVAIGAAPVVTRGPLIREVLLDWLSHRGECVGPTAGEAPRIEQGPCTPP
jgi:5'-nucleotidase